MTTPIIPSQQVLRTIARAMMLTHPTAHPKLVEQIQDEMTTADRDAVTAWLRQWPAPEVPR